MSIWVTGWAEREEGSVFHPQQSTLSLQKMRSKTPFLKKGWHPIICKRKLWTLSVATLAPPASTWIAKKTLNLFRFWCPHLRGGPRVATKSQLWPYYWAIFIKQNFEKANANQPFLVHWFELIDQIRIPSTYIQYFSLRLIIFSGGKYIWIIETPRNLVNFGLISSVNIQLKP